ncbi:response regulator transcription factor [Acuticoccus sp. MNP-M23]|uniref:response regulator transcription factor n=1 Tax=Acuticoccus sp. MNP-M23 TaxID=3072793 RepID=UPI002814B660|nr:response regulator transcription factor [Acuticoccus sp. MNP-M23]WMS41216.1 response regulator transcription factor [Acuticoccus sp. MNP-M23]
MRAGAIRALIVEDEPAIAEALAFLCEREGIETKVISNGAAAMPLLAQYDILILDIMLPGASGFEVAQAARAVDPVPKICVLTAKGQPADKARMTAIGVDAFVTKPFSNRALMDTIRALIQPA